MSTNSGPQTTVFAFFSNLPFESSANLPLSYKHSCLFILDERLRNEDNKQQKVRNKFVGQTNNPRSGCGEGAGGFAQQFVFFGALGVFLISPQSPLLR